MTAPVTAAGRPPWTAWLEASLDDRIVALEDVSSPWGHTRTTRVRLERREDVAVQASTDRGAMDRRRRVAEHLAVEVPSLSVPRPIASGLSGEMHVLVTEWLDGDRATTLLATEEGAVRLSRLMAGVISGVRSASPVGLELSTIWADADALEGDLAGWLDDVRPTIAAIDLELVAAVVRTVPATVAAERPVLAHGDVVPVNLLLRGDEPVVLDLEDARVASPGFDVAHARFVVRRFHPAAWRLMEGPFLQATGTPSDAAALSGLDAMAVAQALERHAAAVRAGEDAGQLAGAEELHAALRFARTATSSVSRARPSA